MVIMALSAFADKAEPPTDDTLAAALGSAAAWWVELAGRVTAMSTQMCTEWGYTSRSTGWGLRLKQGKRVILYMTPGRGSFLASVVLSDRAVQAARDSDLPAPVIALIDGARRYAEGTGVRFEVRGAGDVATALRLVTIKMAN